MEIGDLVRITSDGAFNIDEVGIDMGSVGIIVHIHPDCTSEEGKDMGDLYTVVVNSQRIPYLCDYEIKKIE
jgi:hypothetical protein